MTQWRSKHIALTIYYFNVYEINFCVMDWHICVFYIDHEFCFRWFSSSHIISTFPLIGNNYDIISINPSNVELNPICHLLALLGAHHILHVSRIRVNKLPLFLLKIFPNDSEFSWHCPLDRRNILCIWVCFFSACV